MRPVLLACLLAAPLAALAEPTQVIPVVRLEATPKVDGELGEWGEANWIKVAITPALEKHDRAKWGLDPGDDRNQTRSLMLQLRAGVAGDRLYLALRYPDSTEDTISKPWEWTGDKYVEGRQRDDMLAIRFQLSGDFDRSMLSSKDYKADVWLWSAARTNPMGLAEDMSHHITTVMLDAAAEYESPDKKTIYIKKTRDAGNAPYKPLPRPKEYKGDKIPSYELMQGAGSTADVAAKGKWKKGYWHLEMARALNTGNADDVAFKPGQRILGQIAVFNQGYAEHKSVSEPLFFDFSALK